MASVHRKTGSRHWFAFWRGPDGKLRSRSTKHTSRAKALRMALELERVDRRLREGLSSAEQAQKILGDLCRDLGMDAPGIPTVRAWLAEWLREREDRVGAATAVNYRKAITDLGTFLGADADKPLPTLSTTRLQAWVDALGSRGLAAGTVRVYLEPIRAAVNRAWKRGIIGADVSSELELPTRPAAEKDAFTSEEINALLAVATPDWRLVILAGAYAGLRLGDACSLTWDNVDLVQGLLRFKPAKTRRSGRETVVPLHPRLRAELEARAGDDPHAAVCPTLKDIDSRGSHGTSGQFMRLVKQAGIVVQQRGTGRRKVSSKSAHSLRHSFVRALLSAGVDESIRMKLAGHASKEAHRTYAKAEIDLLRRSIDSLS